MGTKEQQMKGRSRQNMADTSYKECGGGDALLYETYNTESTKNSVANGLYLPPFWTFRASEGGLKARLIMPPVYQTCGKWWRCSAIKFSDTTGNELR